MQELESIILSEATQIQRDKATCSLLIVDSSSKSLDESI